MRKITLFLAVMVAAVTTAFAQIDTAKEYRLKDVASGTYLNASNYDEHSTGPIGGVNSVEYAENNDQIFAFEQEENGYKLKTKSGKYIYCHQWNVDALDNGSILSFVANEDGTYYIMNGQNYFKVELVDGVYYPFCDAPANKAAKFELVEVEATVAPEPEPEPGVEPIVATFSPSAPVSTIWGDGDVTIAFNKAVEYTAPEAGIQIVDANNEVVCNVTSLKFNGAKTSAFVMLDNGISQAGTYTITFPAGAFTSEDGAVSAEMTFTLTIETVIPEPSWWTDFDYTEVTKEFSKLTISFDNLTELKLNNANATWLFTSAGTEFEGTAEIVETVDEKEGKTTTNIVITFGETFTEVGTYYITIPAGMFTMNGTFNNEEKSLQFRINAPIEITPLEIVSVTPAAGDVEKIESIIVTYNQEIGFAYDETWHVIAEKINLVDAEGNIITLTQTGNYFLSLNQIEYAYLGEEPQMNSNWYYQAVPIVAPGTYTLDVSQIIVNYGYDAANYEYNAQGSCEGTYTWTVTGSTAIKGVDAEIANTEIYDITGRRVKNITNAGIYIVNGKKMLVK